MKYGYFDETKKEYVITRPDTPAPWVNYLGSPEYGAIISNNAGGYSFAKSGANGRILRYIFNHPGAATERSSSEDIMDMAIRQVWQREHCVTREMRTATAAEHSVRWCGLHRESTVSSHFWLE